MRALFFLGLLVLPVPIVQAQNAAVEALPPFLQSRVVDSDPLMNFRTQSVPQGRIDRDTGVLRAAYRLAPTVLLGATHEATARAYLDAEAERFGWTTADDLLLVHEIDSHYSAHLTFQQTFGGIPVHNRFVKVNMGPSGHPSMVLSGYAPHLRDGGGGGAVRLQPLMDASGAVLRTQQETLAQRVSTPELVVYPSTPPRLTWRMTASPDDNMAAWEVLMDADTGEILYLRNQAVHMGTPPSASARAAPLASTSSSTPAKPASVPAARAVVDGTGLVFDPDPLTSAGVLHGDPYVDNDDADVEVLNAERKEVVLRDITLGADGLYRLIGPYVEIIEGIRRDPPFFERTTITPPAEADPDAFRYGRANDSFEAVMAYYHIDKNQRYVQSLDVGYPIAEYPIPVSPLGAVNMFVYVSENCIYFGRRCGSPQTMIFGHSFSTGGVPDSFPDSAEDAAMILFGYAWVLWDASVPGPLVINESYSLVMGWAHYWAASYSRGLAEEKVVPEVQDWRTIYNWKRTAPVWANVTGHEFRLDLPAGDRYGEGDPRCFSNDWVCPRLQRLWATTMMEIYDELGKTVTDRLHLASLAYLSAPATFVDAAEALLQADEDLYNGENESVLREKLIARGYLSEDEGVPSTALVLTLVSNSAGEDVGTVDVPVTVSLDADARDTDTSVTINVTDGTATSADYDVSPPTVTLQIPMGMTSITGTVPIGIISDNIAEGDETVTIQATAMGLSSDSEDFTITDNDTESTALVLAIAPARLHEDLGTSWVQFRADLNNAAALMDIPVEVSITEGGTAVEGTDYSASVPTSVMIPAGETSISDSLQITITDDDEVEGNETVVIGISATGLTGTTQELVIIDDETAVRIDVLNVIAQDDGSYTVTAAVRQNRGAPVTSVVLHYGDGITFETTPMQTLVMGSNSLYRAELMAPDEGGILYYHVVATNGDGLTARYPATDGRYWDINDYIEGSRLLLLDFEDGDAGDKSAARHYVAYKGDAGELAEGALALDGVDDHAEILGSSLGESEEFALELMFNADDFDAGALDAGGGYLVAKPGGGCDTCWEQSTFSLLWGGSSNSDTYVVARFWNSEYEGEQIELEVPLSLVAGQWYHAVLEVQKEDAGQRAVLQLRDESGMLYGEDATVLPAPPSISVHPVFVGHIGDRGFFDGRIDNIAFYNYAHFASPPTSTEDVQKVPESYVLEQNYPNPFNPVTTIRYDLARVGHVRLEVSDLLGRRVAVLVDRVQQAGAQEVRFNAGDLPSGMYLYRLRVEDFVSVKKMVLLK